MEHKDLLEMQNQIHQLQTRVNYLESLLEAAGIPYEKMLHSVPDASVDESTMQSDPSDEQASNVAMLTAGVMNQPTDTVDNPTPAVVQIKSETITKRHVQFFYSMFKGRQDVYSKRAGKPSKKTGKTGYYTQCWNYWKDGLCPKKAGYKVRCGECKNQRYKQLTGDVLYHHLMGEREDCSDVVGIYPMLLDETCHFLVFDFDNHDDSIPLDDGANSGKAWIEEVETMRKICQNNGVDVLMERSRSGKGAHIWMFFEEALSAAVARRFGEALLTKGAESVNQKTFTSYDRMIPAQDHMPAGGLGNLIALPLQGQALKNGNSAFIDEAWNPYENQWEQLSGVKKLSKAFVEQKISECSADGVLGFLAKEDEEDLDSTQQGTGISTEVQDAKNNAGDLAGQQIAGNPSKIRKTKNQLKPWENKKRFHSEDIDGALQITLANQIFINVDNIKVRLQNQLRRLAAYSNPEFYKTQAMGFSVRGIPRIVSCHTDEDGYIGLPRDVKDRLLEELKNAGIPYEISDERTEGKQITVSFKGQLRSEQMTAAQKMLTTENGILQAATAFGKTAVGAYFIAERKVNTLVLVPRTELLKQWMEELDKFLLIDEEAPEYTTPTGRIKRRKSCIGRLDSTHNAATGIVDVAMITSLGRGDDINELVKQYGMVIMDECHHAAAQTSLEVLQEVNAKYVYGLTATPKRDDGQQQKVFMQLGPIRYRYTAKDRAREQGIAHYIYPRFTRLVSPDAEKVKVTDANRLIVESEIRNKQILRDVTACIEQGRTPLVLTKNRAHAMFLYENLKDKADHVFLLQGGRSAREQKEVREKMKNIPAKETIILVATGQYVGEGFNYPRLDTMMLTMPISWEGNVEQYSGRLHRDYEEKKDVIIYDYVDHHIKVLENMYHKRLRTYKRMGYELIASPLAQWHETNAIFDSESYKEPYEKDLKQARQQIIISSPGLNQAKVRRLIQLTADGHDSGVKIMVITLDPQVYPTERIVKTIALVDELMKAGIQVQLRDAMHEHYAIIDGEVLWYGSMNLLSREKEDDNLMRVVSKEIVGEVMEKEFGKG